MAASLLIVCLVAPLFANNQQAADERARQKLAALRKYYAQTAEHYEFFRDSEKQEPLTLVTQPVMAWATHDDWSGDVFVWTHAGRPEMIGCILSGPEATDSRKSIQEFHLLGEMPIQPVKMPGAARWAPQAGLTLRPVDGAPKPADGAPLRLSQMRQMLRDFTAHMHFNQRESHLRLLTQPLMRYQPTDGVVIDGALFTYVWPDGGTDPELILLVECRKSEAGLGWYYAPARFSTRELWLKHGEQEVWHGPSLEGARQSDLSLPYYCDTIELLPNSGLKSGK
jgi:hypothetical protein